MGPPALPLIAPGVCCSRTSCPGVSVRPICDLLGRTTCSLLLGFNASGTSEHLLLHPQPGMGAWRWSDAEVITAIKASVTEPAGGREGELCLFSLTDPPSSLVWWAHPAIAQCRYGRCIGGDPSTACGGLGRGGLLSLVWGAPLERTPSADPKPLLNP